MTKRARQREKAGRVTDSDGYKRNRVSESHRSTTASFEENPREGDLALIRQAVRERWPVRQEARGPLADMMTRIALDAEEETTNQIQAARTVLTMEAQNQKDEHLVFQQANKTPQLHLHAHAAVDPERCRARILKAIDCELAERGVSAEDGGSDNGQHHRGNGKAPPAAS